MKEEKHTHGGARAGSGRPRTGRTELLAVRISHAAMDTLNAITSNKSKYIDELILKQRPEQ